MTQPSTESGDRAATIYDVAKKAGVSHNTVSRLLRGDPTVTPAMRKKIERALRELNYRPNMTAKALATHRSHRVGAITHELSETGPSKIIQGASHAAREAGYLLDIVGLDLDDDRSIARALELMEIPDLAGIIALAPTRALVEAFKEASFRVPTYIESADVRADESLNSDLVGTDLLVAHLAELGHRRVATIAGPSGWFAADDRLRSLRRATQERGMQLVAETVGDWSAQSGHRAVHEGLDLSGVTALVVANDQMALGALQALWELGLSVPRDISVVGFDGIPEAAFYQPALTTIALDFDQAGRAAFQHILAEIDPAAARPAPAPGPQLIVRGSTAAAA